MYLAISLRYRPGASRTTLGTSAGGTSVFRADVYYVSRKVFTDMKWGTREPVVFRDTELGMVRLRSFGNFTMRIKDAQLFINTMVGSMGQMGSDQIESFLKQAIVARLAGTGIETTWDREIVAMIAYLQRLGQDGRRALSEQGSGR